MSAEITLDKLGDRMSAADRETFTTAMGLVTPWLLAERDRFALLHGDYRLDNLLFDPGRTPGRRVVDWQTLGVGLPARDLAYFTATSLKSQLRAAIEKDLVDEYHRALAGYGVTGYDRETCWRDYRLGVPQALLISALGFAFATATERGDDMVLTMLARGCQAIRDLGTLELVGEYAAAEAHRDRRSLGARLLMRISTASNPDRPGLGGGDVARFVAGQPAHRVGDVFRLSNPVRAETV